MAVVERYMYQILYKMKYKSYKLQNNKMGIKNLHQFLRKKCPECYKQIHLSNLAYKKVAVDVSLFLFKYKSAVGDRWIHAFINLILALRRNNVHCYFVYDGPSPKEKEQEKEKRKSSKDKIQERAHDIEFALDTYNKTGEIMDILRETMKRRKSPKKVKKLLGKKSKEEIDVRWLEDYLARIQGQVVKMTKEDISASKQLFDILGVPYTTSLCEAETLCAHLARDGKVYGALSEDTDLLACEASVFLHKLNTRDDTCYILNLEQVREALELDRQEFQDFCIMCGTDYNSNLPKIGPMGAYKLIKEHGNLDSFPNDIDVSSLTHTRVREIFSTYPSEVPDTTFCGTPQWDKLSGFLFKHNCHAALANIQTVLNPVEIVFAE